MKIDNPFSLPLEEMGGEDLEGYFLHAIKRIIMDSCKPYCGLKPAPSINAFHILS